VRPRARRAARRTWDRRPNPERRAQLLADVEKYLLAHGLPDFTLRKAARAGGTSAQLLVHHFGTKERLVSEVLGSIMESYLGSVFTFDDASGGSFEDLFWSRWRSFTTDEYLRILRLMYEIFSAVFRDPTRFPNVLESISARWLSGFVDSLTAIGLPPPAARRLSTAYFAALRGLLLDLLVTGDRERVDDAAGLVAENLKRDMVRALEAATGSD
jgi:AcrR family transcriptional regulator